MRAAFAILLSIASSLINPAQAQTSDKPIRLIVPYPAGGTTDLLARAIAPKMSERLGQTVVIENKAGAGGVIGAQQVAKSAPDGLTLVFVSIASHGIIPALQEPPPYDAVKDFAAITLVANTPNVLMANPDFAAKTVKDLIVMAKQNPGKINFGSTSHGGSPHMSGELLKLMTGIDLTHVPYKGGSPMLIDLMGGQIPIGFDNLPSSMTYIKSGKVKALAVTTAKRWPGAPDIPTMAEAGVPGYESGVWFGLVAPNGTPKEIIAKINTEMLKGLKSPDFVRKMNESGYIVSGSTPEQMVELERVEVPRWAAIVKASGAKAD